jgi:SnoaL-like polyketide cyclase
VDVFNTGRSDSVEMIVDRGYLDHQGLGGQPPRGPSGFQAVVSAPRSGFDSLDVVVGDLIESEDRAAARLRWMGARKSGESDERGFVFEAKRFEPAPSHTRNGGIPSCPPSIRRISQAFLEVHTVWSPNSVPGAPREGGPLAAPDESRQHLPNLNRGGSRGNDRVAGGEGSQLFLVLGLDDTQSPRSSAVEHRAEDHHVTRINERSPIRRMTSHDLPLLFGHVESKDRTWSVQPEHEGGHLA